MFTGIEWSEVGAWGFNEWFIGQGEQYQGNREGTESEESCMEQWKSIFRNKSKLSFYKAFRLLLK